MKKPILALALAAGAFFAGLVVAERGWFPSRPLHRIKALFGSDSGRAGDLVLGRDGSWHRARDLQSGAADVSNQELANLPYLSGSRDATDVVTVAYYDPEKAQDGVNLLVSGHAPEAVLVDMKGNPLHVWRKPLAEIWPGPLGFEEWEVHGTFWRRAHLFANGDLLAVFEGIGMVKLDLQSNVLWEYKGRAHHDLEVQPDGRIFTLTRHERTEHPDVELQKPIVEDFVVELDQGGKELRRVSVLDCLLHSDFAPLLAKTKWAGDVLHTNTIEVLDGRHAARHPAFQQGRVLVSIPTVNAVAVLDLEQQKCVWALAGLWVFQHQPNVLANGDLLVFDNMGADGASRVLEIDPSTQAVAWQYRGSDDAPLSSRILGSCARLPNGNTLITESTAGRAVEVTRAGEVVWEFYSPFRAGDDDELVASLLEVLRLDPETFTGGLAELVAAGDGAPVQLQGVDSLIEKLGGPGK